METIPIVYFSIFKCTAYVMLSLKTLLGIVFRLHRSLNFAFTFYDTDRYMSIKLNDKEYLKKTFKFCPQYYDR